jgi:multidrug transporter EmrE-like cation transporter
VSEHAIGVLLGLGAALAFELSYLLLATQARRLETVIRPGASFLARLAQRPWWLAAMALGGAAFFLELAALRRVSLVVVQPLLALGLVGLVLASRLFLHEPVGPSQLAGASLVAIGVTVVIFGAPSGTVKLPLSVATVLVVTALLACLFIPQLARTGAWALVAAAAAGDTIAALATNSVAANWPQRIGAVVVGVVAVAVCGLTAIASESAALQRLPVYRVGPIVSGVQTTLPVLLAVLLGDQRWASAPAHGALLGAGVLMVGAGGVCLGSTRLMAHMRQAPNRVRLP